MLDRQGFKATLMLGAAMLVAACGGGSAGDEVVPPAVTPPAISGATQASYSVGPVDATMNGHQFRVAIQNPAGVAISQAAVLTVAGASGAGPGITLQRADRTVTVGQTASLPVAVSAGFAGTYQRLRNGAPIAGATAQTHVTPVVQAGDAHSITLLSDGSVWGWGSNTNGQLARAVNGTDDWYGRNPAPIEF